MAKFSLSRPRVAVAVLAISTAAGVMLFGTTRSNATAPSATRNPPEVEVAVVEEHSVIDWQSYSGRLAAVEKVDVRPMVSGPIVSVNIRDGALVKKGDVLFVIDPRPYRAEVSRAAGLLAAAQARVDYTRRDWERAQRLIGEKAIARREYDEKQNAEREASANLLVAQAGLESAQVNLDYTKILAPVAGRVSRAEITVGNVVTAGAGAVPLTSIVSQTPIYGEFNVDEQTYLQYIGQVKNAQKLPVKLGLANETSYSREGVIQSVDNHLNTSSGTIRVRARFENSDGALIPGLYGKFRVGGSVPHEAIVIDEKSINTDQDKKFVLVLDKNDQIEYREIKLGNLYEDQRVIQSGLSVGERIVVSGMQRVKPGDKARAQMAAKPAAGQKAIGSAGA